MVFSRLKKRRRGQIRAVDFIVSLFLFIIMMTQLILIIINVQSGIQTGIVGELTYEKLDIFGRQLLLEEGDINWGYLQELPSTFGLSDSKSETVFTLDASKMARIVTGTSYSISSISGYETYDYDTLTKKINLESDYEFQLAFFPCLEINVTVQSFDFTSNIVTVDVMNPHNSPIFNAQVHFFVIDLTYGAVTLAGTSPTDSRGSTSLIYEIPHIDDPDAEHFIFVIVRKGELWSMNWGSLPNELIVIGASSDTTIWGGGTNSSTLLLSDIFGVVESLDNHFLSIIYQNTTSDYSFQTVDLGTSDRGNISFTIPNEGLVAFFSIARFGNSYKVGVGSYPAILDRDLTSGIFYQVFGSLDPGERVKSMVSKTYPVVVRGTLMRCQVTMWSS
ncbi:MAG: hypothetical protein JSV04_13280 [Candidatus Heimdallarchaeota archaeon]|nr:MAG: hypothetical protein JSV04_13280 [Candidatus Heimdallarchaeota archaeon]